MTMMIRMKKKKKRGEERSWRRGREWYSYLVVGVVLCGVWSVGNAGEGSAQTERTTVNGNACTFPAIWKGNVLRECSDVYGIDRLFCRASTGLWEECAPVPSAAPAVPPPRTAATATPRYTVSNQQCVIPFVWNGEQVYDCVTIGNSLMCEVPSGGYEPCAPRGTDTSAAERAAETAPAEGEDMTVQIQKRFAVNGLECIFPTTYRGEAVYGCLDVQSNGVLKCKTSRGTWDECAPEGSTGGGSTGGSGSEGPSRLTLSGKPCVFPFEVRGATFNDCTMILGKESCKTAIGQIEQCRPKDQVAPGTRVSVSGSMCVFPVTYRGETVTDCTMISGKSQCRTERGIWEECDPTSQAAAAAAVPPPSSSSSSNSLVRTTVTGKPCKFPFEVRGRMFNDCTMMLGKMSCLTERDEVEECAPADTPAPSTPETAAVAIPVGARVSTSGSLCVFPIDFRGETLTDCTPISGKDQCKTERGIWEECAPRPPGYVPPPTAPSRAPSLSSNSLVRKTVTGKTCKFPFDVRGATFNDCTMLLGKLSCLTERDEVEECVPMASDTTMTDTGPSMRVSKSGNNCVFPVTYRGEVITDCTLISGSMKCRTERGLWEECADANSAEARASVASKGRSTVRGNQCALPFTYRGATFDDCTMISGKVSCMTERGIIEECVPMSDTSAPAPAPNPAVPAGTRVSMTGYTCVFPTTYRGQVLTDCYDVNGTSKCKTDRGLWEECAAGGSSGGASAGSSGARMTVKGNACTFPFTVRGASFNDCTMITGKMSCQTASGDIEECAPISAPATSPSGSSFVPAGTRVSVSGSPCVFPIDFRGETLTDCTLISGKKQCKTQRGIWEECVPLSAGVTNSNDYKVLALFPSRPPFPAGSYYDQVYSTLTSICVAAVSCQLTTKKVVGDVQGMLERQARSGAFDHVILAGEQFGPTVKISAPKFPNLRFSVIDYAFMPPLENVEGIIFRDDQVGFLAGIVACEVALASSANTSGNTVRGQAGKVAVVPGTEEADMTVATIKRVNGFKMGCASISQDVGVDVYFGSSASSVSNRVANAYPSVVFGSGTQVGHDVLKRAASFGIYVIGVDGDEYQTTFDGGNVAGADRVLTSALKRLDVAAETSLKDGLTDSFRARNVILGVDDDALDLAPCNEACSVYTSELQRQTEVALYGLADGSVDTGVNRVTGAITGLPPSRPPPVAPAASTSAYKVLVMLPSSPPFPAGSYYDQVYSTLSAKCTSAVKCSLTTKTVSTDIQADLEAEVATGKYDHVIVAGEQFGPPVAATAPKFPTVRFTVIDYPFVPPLVNAEGIIFRDDEIGYLAGTVACQVTLDATTTTSGNTFRGQAGKVAVVAGTEEEDMSRATKKRVNGFKQGCASVSPDIGVDVYFGSDAAKVRSRVANKYPSVVFGSGTQVGHDVLKSAAGFGIYVIGVDGDEYKSTFGSGSVAGADRVLTSAVKRLDIAAETSLNDGLANTFRARNVLLSLKDKALELASCNEACSVYTYGLQAKTSIVIFGLQTGDTSTGVNRVTGELVGQPTTPPARPSAPTKPPAPVNDPNTYNVLAYFPSDAPFPVGSYYDQVYSTLTDLCVAAVKCDLETKTASSDLKADLQRDLSTGMYDHVIVAGEQYGEPIAMTAPAFPLMRFTVIDYAFMPPIQNVEGVSFRDDQVGFLAGVAACEVALETSTTTSGNTFRGQAAKVAVVAGTEEADMTRATKKRVNGFKQGCASVSPDIGVDVYFGSNAALVNQRIANKYPAIVFGSGTQVGHDVLKSAAGFGIPVIGVDGDEYVSTFGSGSVAGADKVLTSAVKRLDRAAETSLNDGLVNSFKGRNIILGLEDGAVELAPCNDACGTYTYTLQAKTSIILFQLAAGDLQTGINRVTGDIIVRPVPPPVIAPADDPNNYRVLALFPADPPFPAGSYYDQVLSTLSDQCVVGVSCALITKTVSTDIRADLEAEVATDKYDHVIAAGDQFGPPVAAAAAKFPTVRFTVIDYAFVPPLVNAEGIIFRDDEVGYVAGIVACQVTLDATTTTSGNTFRGQAGKVAVVAGTEEEDMSRATKKRVNGFKQGCASVSPDIGVDVYFGTSADSVSRRITNKYPSVVFGSGTQVGHDVLKSAAGFGIYVIGVDGDEYVSTFGSGSVAGADKVLTSTLKRLDIAAETSLKDGLSDTFRARNVLLSLKEDALDLAPCNAACSVYTPALQKQTDIKLFELKTGYSDTGVNRVTGDIIATTPPASAAPAYSYSVLGLFPSAPPFPANSYYDQVYKSGMRECNARNSCKFDYAATNGIDYESILAVLVEKAATGEYNQILMAGEEFAGPVASAASQFPTMRFSVIDAAFAPPIQNVEGVIFKDSEVGYLAGVVACEVALDLAGGVTTRGASAVVAVVAGPEEMTRPTKKRVNGFTNGCLSVCAKCDILTLYGTSASSILAKLTVRYPAVVFSSGTPVGHEVIKGAASFGMNVIGTDYDEYKSTFRNGREAGADKVLTSAVKRLDVAAATSVRDGLTDNFKGRNVLLSLRDDALFMAPCNDACAVYTPELQAQTQVIIDNLNSGVIDTGVNRVTGELTRFPAPPAPPTYKYTVLGLYPTPPEFIPGSYYDQVHSTLKKQCNARVSCKYDAMALSGAGATMEEIQATLADQAGSGAYSHIIMAGEMFGEPVRIVAPSFPTTRFTMIDYPMIPPVQNVEAIIYRDDQVGYLAGVVACRVAQDAFPETASVAVVAGLQTTETKKRVNGFMVGCLSVCESCEMDIMYASTPFTVQQQLDKSPGVVFGSGTQVGHDALVAATQQGIFAIGVDADEWETTFDSGSVEGAELVLTSAVKSLSTAAERSLADGLSNTFRGRNVLLSIDDGALMLADCHEACDVYTPELQMEMQEIFANLSAGVISTGVDRVNGDLMVVIGDEADTSDDSSSSGGLSGGTIAIISIIGAIAVGFAIFALVMFVREKKGAPMFVNLEEDSEAGGTLDSPKSTMSPAPASPQL